MRTDVYEGLAHQAEFHWWFQARERILLEFIEARAGEIFPSSRTGRILDIGAGSGRLAMSMMKYGEVSALEGAPEVLEILKDIPGLTLFSGFLPNDALPQGHFDLVTAFDVLEHIEDDRTASRQIFELVRPGGNLMVTVPAHPFLWSDHDLIHHHFRRYRPKAVESLLQSAGFDVLFSTPFQCYLFPLLLVDRTLRRFAGRSGGGKASLGAPPKPVNEILRWIFSREAGRVARGRKFPIGSSHLILAHRSRSTQLPDGGSTGWR